MHARCTVLVQRSALSGTRVEPLQALADELGERAHVLPCNLSDPEAVEALPKQAAEAMGSVDILVNNAGITRDNLFMRMSDEEWQSVIDVNMTSTMKLCKGVIRGMMKSRWGRIVNVSSVVAAIGNPGQANYAASKAGMIGFSKALGARSGNARNYRERRGAGFHHDCDDRKADRGAEKGSVAQGSGRSYG